MSVKSGAQVKYVDNFKYLGSRIMDSEKDFKIRKALAWTACNKMDKIWRSNLPNQLKLDIFKTVIEPILMYGSETWVLSSRLQKHVDGCYTSLLIRVQNNSWRYHPTLEQIYGDMPRLRSHLIQRPAQFAGHALLPRERPACLRSDIIEDQTNVQEAHIPRRHQQRYWYTTWRSGYSHGGPWLLALCRAFSLDHTRPMMMMMITLMKKIDITKHK